jgi:uncharacterized membrane protein YtjA (UPF0391 family)
MKRGKGGPCMGLGNILFWLVVILLVIRLLKI